MREIVINKIKEPSADLYNPADQYLGTVCTLLEMNDVRVQIAKDERVGYYFLFHNERVPVEPNGQIKEWPEGFFDLELTQLADLFKTHRK